MLGAAWTTGIPKSKRVSFKREKVTDAMSSSIQIPNLGPKPREDTSLVVARNLLNFLLTSELRKGDRLPPERVLAEAAGVSRPVMREALKALGFLGLLEVRPGDGTFLADTQSALLPKVIQWSMLLGEKSTRDVIQARTYIEVAVARVAAAERTDTDVAILRGHLDTMLGAVTDKTTFREADVAFHLALATASNNVVFADLLNSMHALLDVWSAKTLEVSRDLEPYYREHLAVFEAVEAQDADAASLAMEEHMLRALDRFEALTESDDS